MGLRNISDENSMNLTLFLFLLPSSQLIMANISSLPVELFDKILSNLNIQDLRSCTLVCRRFHESGNTWLYKDVDLNLRAGPWCSCSGTSECDEEYWDEYQRKSVRRQKSFLEAIAG